MNSLPNATVYSVYFGNINKDVLEYQKKCVDRFLPSGWTFQQYFWDDNPTYAINQESFPHAAAMQRATLENKNDLTIFLDVDCIPLVPNALPILATAAQHGVLTGAIQRANHIDNGNHLYVGPFCMAFSKRKYLELGSPTFNATERGDIGEELTYKWSGENQSVAYLWPSQVEKPMWSLYGTTQFGLGTTYDNLFYHFFCVRNAEMQQEFVNRCKMFLNRQVMEPTLA